MSEAEVTGGAVSPRVVHVVSKTHCDLGFTDLAADVVRHYCDDFFPRALATADELRESGQPARLVWTTGALVLAWALRQGSPDQRAAVAAGVARGDLAWHALPATTHTELMDADLCRSGLGISAELDQRFSPPGHRTSAAKLTDVPGHTRGLVPLLAEAGVTFLHVGVNPAWPVPDVPTVFRWQAPDGSEVVVAYQAGGYGGTVVVPGCDEVLTFLHADDNLGPPSAEEVIANHVAVQARFPGAEVRASTLDAWARVLAASGAASALPVVTAEIGDPWLFGAAGDPAKVAAYRELLRARLLVRERLEADGEAPGPDLVDADRSLLLVAEHTWGLDQKTWLPDTEHWDRAGLAQLRRTPAGARFEASWAEQREYVDRAARLLAGRLPVGTGDDLDPDEPVGGVVHHLRGIDAAVLAGPPGPPDQYRPLAPGETVEGGAWTLSIDPVHGGLVGLVEQASGRVLADGDHPLGVVSYQSFDADDYERFYAGLTPAAADEWWARWDNTKPGIDAVPVARSGRWTPTTTRSWYRAASSTSAGAGDGDAAGDADGGVHEVVVQARFDAALHEDLGAPAPVWIRWCWADRPGPGAPTTLTATVGWPDKPANRLPEALWCSFVPRVDEPERWEIDKLGQWVSPLDVVRRGGRSLHGVGDGGLVYQGSGGALVLHTVDAPLVAPGRPNLLDADPPLPDLAGGWHVLLAANCWGTNFPMWIEGPARFRFTVTLPG